MTSQRLYDSQGRAVTLRRRIGGGGEGEVYLVDRERCAKVYHRAASGGPSRETHEKVLAMLSNPPEDYTWTHGGRRSIAWPLDVLYRDAARTDFAGFLMPLIDFKKYRPIDAYFAASERVRELGPGATWELQLIVARNLASVMAAVHAKRHCVGDLNDQNVLVAPDGHVALVDCDSFQVYDGKGRFHPCLVTRGEYAAPELHQGDLRDIDRYHPDLFALATIVFRLLMDGRFPYSAVGSAVARAASPEEKVLLGRFAYANPAPGVLEPPPGAPDYGILPPQARALLREAFVDGHRVPSKRPPAERWLKALEDAAEGLVRCSAVPSTHRHGTHLAACPWCAHARRTGRDLFPPLRGTGPSPLGAQTTLPPRAWPAAAGGGGPTPTRAPRPPPAPPPPTAQGTPPTHAPAAITRSPARWLPGLVGVAAATYLSTDASAPLLPGAAANPLVPLLGVVVGGTLWTRAGLRGTLLRRSPHAARVALIGGVAFVLSLLAVGLLFEELSGLVMFVSWALVVAACLASLARVVERPLSQGRYLAAAVGAAGVVLLLCALVVGIQLLGAALVSAPVPAAVP